MALRKFTDFGAASRNKVTLRINRGIFISNSILRKYKASQAKAVYLYVDDERPLIGVKFLDVYEPNDKECRKISIEKSGISFNITPILRLYNVNKREKKTDLKLRLDGDLLIIDLSELIRS